MALPENRAYGRASHRRRQGVCQRPRPVAQAVNLAAVAVLVFLFTLAPGEAQFTNPDPPYNNGQDLSLTRETLLGSSGTAGTTMTSHQTYTGTVPVKLAQGYGDDVLTTSVLAELATMRRLAENGYRMLCAIFGAVLFSSFISKIHV